MGLRSDHTIGRWWGRKEETPVIQETGRRCWYNMISAITNRGALSFTALEHGLRANEFVDSLTRLCRSVGKKVLLIVDRQAVHRSRKVMASLKAYRDRIRVLFLPPYNSELNPGEVLNQNVKSNAVGREPPHSPREMMSTVRWFLEDAA